MPPISGIWMSIRTTSYDERGERRERFQAVVGDRPPGVRAGSAGPTATLLIDDVVLGQQNARACDRRQGPSPLGT